MTARRAVVIVALAAAAVTPVVADDRQAAAAHYDRGVALYRGADFPAALAEFEAAHQLTRDWRVLWNVGVTQKKLFRYDDAVVTLERYLAEGGAAIDPDRRHAVEVELREIRALVAEVTVVVPGAAATIELDGRAIGTSPLARPLLIAAGPHRLRATRDGELPDDRSFSVVSGDRATIELAPRPAPRLPTMARVTVRSSPLGATLTIDQRPMGPAPWRGELAPGGHAVVARLPGHRPRTLEIVVAAGQERGFELELDRLPGPRPWYRRPWVWAGAGAVALAVATTVYFTSQPTRYDVNVHYP